MHFIWCTRATLSVAGDLSTILSDIRIQFLHCTVPFLLFNRMSHIKTIEDLKTSVAELASLMNDTFTCCKRNYDALLPYIGKKETNFKIYHKLINVNIMLNKLSEELVGLRVEYVTLSSYEQRMEISLFEGGRKRRKCDVLELGRHETKSIKMEVPYSDNTKCCISLTSETGINMQSKNLESEDTEETRQSPLPKSDIHRPKNIKTEIQDSNEVENLFVFPIGNNDIPADQTSFDTGNNRVTVCSADDEKSASVAGSLVRDNAYDKPGDTITQRENTEECFPLESLESQTSNQEKYEDIGSVVHEDHSIHRYLGGKVDCTTSFSYHSIQSSSGEESPVALTACDSEIDRSLQGRSNTGNKEKKRAPDFPIIYENGQSSEELCDAGDELYGIVRHQNGRFKCPLRNDGLVNYQAVPVRVKRKQHKRKRKISKKNSCATVSEVPNDSCEGEFVNYQAVNGHLKGKAQKMKQKTAKNNSCARMSDVPNNSCEGELINYQAVHNLSKGKMHKMKRKAAKKNSCVRMLEVPNNSCESELVNYQAAHSHSKGKMHKMKRKTAKKNSCARLSEVTNNCCEDELVNYQAMNDHPKEKKDKIKRKTAKKNSYARVSEVPNNSCGGELVNSQAVQGHTKQIKPKKKRITAKNSCAQKSEVTNSTTQCKVM
ncbi:uncharacterized protein LOC126336294 isoform X1 [Schistocerca gregaria]|uniref:uncharacterized protein LOC126336294 isoform X1 n=2 Tax=Schistocerca gregaria TaxID=7010 RepID=UPI00211E3E3F|nr:uncharacterized protein LOC126336294 isoform X1 [Schistocerca gregaria]